jgi:hypothetical protein
VITYSRHIARKDCQNNKNAIFIFGDNDERKGYGGLAKELRGEPNAIGIRVKKKPTREPDAYYTDDELETNISKITEDINKVIDWINEGKYDTIVFPYNGIGTGLADMERKCPETFKYMNLVLEGTLAIKNGSGDT